MSEIRVNSIGNESNTGGPVLSGITTFSGQQYFIPPTGTTAQRPSACPPGSIRFNTDSAHLEYWNGLVWLEFEASSEELGDQNNTNSTGGTGHRGLFHIGYNGSRLNTVEYVTISTLGNAQDFGDLTVDRSGTLSCSSRVRALFAGGMGPNASAADTNIIDFFTISSTGNAADFGDRTITARDSDGFSNQTRGCFAGANGGSDVIDFVTIAQTGNAVDFGNLSTGRSGVGAFASSTKGIISGGSGPSNIIEYVIMSTQGNGQDFGDLITSVTNTAGLSSAVRGVIGGGESPSATNVIQFITIATNGNSQDFGDLTVARGQYSATSSSVRGVFARGYGAPAGVNVMDYVQIMSTGNAIDFGDLVTAGWTGGSCSNGHGGL